ncbi:O-antigen ligase family protein [Novosphingobium tardum]|uniref:O-antigen ligase family protein n=1 Tax=Novosphingobium tardum TaxID=1538021 RepID=A0ABV8RKZ6_9SPHN
MSIFKQVQQGFGARTLANLTLFVLVSAWLFGGATRFDVFAPVLPMLAALVVLALLAVTPGRRRLSFLEKACIAGLFLIAVVQLVPLPPQIWRQLPAHEYPAHLLGLFGQSPWLPLSLTPSRTISSGFAFAPALAVYLAARDLPAAQANRILGWLVAFAGISALLGLLQVSGGTGSKLRFYAITNDDAAVGFFSNANHFGTFVALCAPIAVYLGLRFDLKRREASYGPLVLGGGVALLLIAGAIASFSRAAYGAAAIALLLSAFMILLRLPIPRRARGFAISGLALAIAVAGLVLVRTPLFQHLAETDQVGTDGRLALVPVYLRMIAASFPFGTGLGSFDATYRAFENYEKMSANYLNNAHNDLAQVVIEAGLLGLVVLIGWVVLIGRTLGNAARHPEALEGERSLGWLRLAVLAYGIIVLLGHSLVDYPLRGAAASATFALLLALTVGGASPLKRREDEG